MDDLVYADTGGEAIPVPYLKQLWQRSRTGEAADAAGWSADKLTLWGLGLGLQETFQFLHGKKPSFAEFERWILDCNGGAVAAERVAELNGRLSRLQGKNEEQAGAATIRPAVLTARDLRFWDENGYVVLCRAVEPGAAAAAAQAIWACLGMSPEAPESWHADEARDGIFVKLVRHPAFAANRASERIWGAFAQLWGTEDLAVSVDRGGFNPPEQKRGDFRGTGLHWDTSLSRPIPLDIQGVLYLTDTAAEQGAFQCVPGFHRRIDDWLAGLPPGADPRAQDLSAGAVKVPGQAGDMVIWHAALPHGATPNRAAHPRLVQYISCFPVDRVDARPWL